MKTLFVLAALLCGTPVFAQKADSTRHRADRIGTRVALGASHFYGLENLEMESDAALQIGLVVRHEFAPWFAVELQPAYHGKRAIVRGTMTADSQPPQEYIDYYHLYNIDVPVIAVFRYGFGHYYIKGFAGPAADFNVYATQERAFRDPAYSDQTWADRRILKDMELVTFTGLGGVGFEIDTRAGLFGIDLRYYQPFTPAGSINDDRFFVSVGTLGVSWMY